MLSNTPTSGNALWRTALRRRGGEGAHARAYVCVCVEVGVCVVFVLRGRSQVLHKACPQPWLLRWTALPALRSDASG
jgi:hypothetical protein